MSSKKKSKSRPRKRKAKNKVLKKLVQLNPSSIDRLTNEVQQIRKAIINNEQLQKAVSERVMHVFDMLVEAMTYQLVSASKAGNLIMESSFAQTMATSTIGSKGTK